MNFQVFEYLKTKGLPHSGQFFPASSTIFLASVRDLSSSFENQA